MPYEHALPSGFRSLGSFHPLAEGAHGSIIAFVHTPCLTQQDPGFIATFTQVPVLDGCFQEKGGFGKRSILCE